MRAVVFAGLAWLVVGCGGGQSGEGAPQVLPEGEAFLEVDNQSWANFNVYLVWEGIRERVGRSAASTREAYEISSRLVGDGGRWMQVLLDPIGARINQVSRRIQVFPGDTIHVQIPPT